LQSQAGLVSGVEIQIGEAADPAALLDQIEDWSDVRQPRSVYMYQLLAARHRTQFYLAWCLTGWIEISVQMARNDAGFLCKAPTIDDQKYCPV
jgi:hypothetical protein